MTEPTSMDDLAGMLRAGKISYGEFAAKLIDLRNAARIPIIRGPQGIGRQGESPNRAESEVQKKVPFDRSAEHLAEAIDSSTSIFGPSEIELLRAALKEATDTNTVLNGQFEEIRARQRELEALASNHDKLATELETLRQSQAAMANENAELTNQLETSRRNVSELQDRLQTAESENTKLTRHAAVSDALESEIHDLRTALEASRNQIDSLRSELVTAVMIQAEAADLREEVELSKSRLNDSISREAALEDELRDVHVHANAAEQKLKQKSEEIAALTSALESHQSSAENEATLRLEVERLTTALAESREAAARAESSHALSQAHEPAHPMHHEAGFLSDGRPHDSEALKTLATAIENEIARQKMALDGITQRESAIRSQLSGMDQGANGAEPLRHELSLREKYRRDIDRRMNQLNRLLNDTIKNLRRDH